MTESSVWERKVVRGKTRGWGRGNGRHWKAPQDEVSSVLRGCSRRLSGLRPWLLRPGVSSACLLSRWYWEGKRLTLPGQRWPISDRPLLSFANIATDSTCSLHLKCSRTRQRFSLGSPNNCHSNNASQPPQACFGSDLLTSR